MLNYIQLAENYVLSVGIFFFSHSLTGRKMVQKGGFGPKCSFFPKNWLKAKG